MELTKLLQKQPQAQVSLMSAFSGEIPRPAHAYLFVGPRGSGKGQIARAFAAELLSDRAADPADTKSRVLRGTHPDFTVISASGATEMRASDVEGPLVGAASSRPFEARWRMFLIEDADLMSEAVANRLLKTLEEPASFVCIVLLASSDSEILPTIKSRCRTLRIAGLPKSEIADLVMMRAMADPQTSLACANLALGDAKFAVYLAGPEGTQVRAAVQTLAAELLAGRGGSLQLQQLIALADNAGKAFELEAMKNASSLADGLAEREQKRFLKDANDNAVRRGKRARNESLDLSLLVLSLWFRDLAAHKLGADDTDLYNSDQLNLLANHAAMIASHEQALRAVDQVDRARMALKRHASAELQLAAMCVRVTELIRR